MGFNLRLKLSWFKCFKPIVPGKWQFIHLFFLVFICSMSMLSLVYHYKMQTCFEGRCPLYAKVHAQCTENRRKCQIYGENVPDKEHKTAWGSKGNCYYTFLVSALSFAFAGIWSWFFAVCAATDHEGVGVRKPWQLIPPATVFAFIMFIIVGVAAAMLSEGMRSFCSGMTAIGFEKCRLAEKAAWKEFERIDGFYRHFVKAEAGFALAAIGWFLLLLSFILRCCLGVDFDK